MYVVTTYDGDDDLLTIVMPIFYQQLKVEFNNFYLLL